VRCSESKPDFFGERGSPDLLRHVLQQMRLYTFMFDETFKGFQGQGSAINLSPLYSQAGISILKMSYVFGSDEVVLVDSNAQVRIFSFVTQQFR
jgi:hypothetical protein